MKILVVEIEGKQYSTFPSNSKVECGDCIFDRDCPFLKGNYFCPGGETIFKEIHPVEIVEKPSYKEGDILLVSDYKDFSNAKIRVFKKFSGKYVRCYNDGKVEGYDGGWYYHKPIKGGSIYNND